MEKECRRCNIIKPISSFYIHKQMGDGHLNVCKDCVKKRVSTHRVNNLESIREYDRERGQQLERKAKNKQRYRKRISTEEGRRLEWEKQRAASRKHRPKKLVRAITRRAILAGILIPKPCERCENSNDIEAHHEDYSRPLDVIWLCKACHGERHREINAELRRKPSVV